MAEVRLTLPDGFEQAVQLTPAEFEAQVRLMAAIKMFELGKLSSGRAAELAGVTRVEFFELCARYEVPVVDTPTDVLEAQVEFLSQWKPSPQPTPAP